ncbi:MAG TPA: LacI family DNA-binding transcriptional regulator, partial [Acidothermaceae bacterium]|nr:LacI family DNA-binding transcriptional regulator [Acidothermaceae bacterium]
GRVSEQTVRRVRAVAQRLGYTPNALAKGLRTARTSTVGVVLPDLTNPLFPPIVRGIEDVLARQGYVALLANTDNDDQREVMHIDALRARRVDGFIVATARRDHPLLEAMALEGVPIVLVNRTTDRHDISAVLGNETSGIAAAVEHLVSLGHTSIAHVAGPHQLSTGLTRSDAFRAAMRSHGLRLRKSDVIEADAYTVSAGFAATDRLLATGRPVTAVLAANDMIAVGALQALAAKGLRCPEDVSVVGFNDMPFVDQLSPPLTTVRLPQYDVGMQAAQLLLDRLADPKNTAKSVVLPVALVVRGSTGPCQAPAVAAG